MGWLVLAVWGVGVFIFTHRGTSRADDASTCQLAAAAGAAHTRLQRSHTHSDIAAAARTPRARVNAGRECRLPGGGAPAATAPPSPVHGRIMVLTGAQELDELHHTPRHARNRTAFTKAAIWDLFMAVYWCVLVALGTPDLQ